MKRAGLVPNTGDRARAVGNSVTAAQVTLNHLVKVQILVPQPQKAFRNNDLRLAFLIGRKRGGAPGLLWNKIGHPGATIGAALRDGGFLLRGHGLVPVRRADELVASF